jgi:hypothetical protein
LIDVRIYRAALIPALLALVVVMFSLEERPQPLVSVLAPDAFDSEGASTTVRDLVRRFPDRHPGSEGNAQVAELVAGRFESLNLETDRDRFVSEVEGEDVTMSNVTGVLSGPSDRQLVVLAHRDAARPPGASSAAGTATLLELASALAGVRHEKTIVFVSTDGGQADSAGARRFAESYRDLDKVDAALVVDDIAAARPRRPYLLPWSSDSRRSALQLLRSASAALEREVNADPGSESSFGQFMRQAWPLTLREQGPLVEQGVDALALTSRGELPRPPGSDTVDELSEARLQRFGKAALATVLAVDSAGALESSPPSYVVSARKVIPAWALSLLAFALLAPPLVAAVDGFARARRRGRPVGRWGRWVLSASVPFVLIVAAAYAFQLLDWLPDTASEALAEPSRPSLAEAAPALVALTLLLALGWLLARPLVLGHAMERGVPGPEAGIALALLLSLELLLLWFMNPFAALLLVPAAHFALLPALAETLRRPLLAGTMILGALLLPALVLFYYGARLELGLDIDRYALLLVTSAGSVWSALVGSLIAGSLVSTVLIALAKGPEAPRAEITVRGPRTYAGPGSLGGTESALRR